MEITNLLQTKDRGKLREWLQQHHQTKRECWVITYRSKCPVWDALPYLDVVEEALCFGWIDSTNKRLPDGRLAQRLSPRRNNSHWTELNRQRCRDLELRGLMTEAGRKALSVLMLLVIVLTASAQVPLRKVYDETINPLEQVEQAVQRANAEDKFVVCQVGGNWCPWCLRFADFAVRDSVVRRAIDENFVFIHVNYNPRKSDNPEAAKALMARLGQPARFGFPVFVVLDTEGRVLHIQDSSFLEEGQGYSQERVLRFLLNWTPKVVSRIETKPQMNK